MLRLFILAFHHQPHPHHHGDVVDNKMAQPSMLATFVHLNYDTDKVIPSGLSDYCTNKLIFSFCVHTYLLMHLFVNFMDL